MHLLWRARLCKQARKSMRARAGLVVWGQSLLPCFADACFSGESMPSIVLLTDVTNICVCVCVFFFLNKDYLLLPRMLHGNLPPTGLYSKLYLQHSNISLFSYSIFQPVVSSMHAAFSCFTSKQMNIQATLICASSSQSVWNWDI